MTTKRRQPTKAYDKDAFSNLSTMNNSYSGMTKKRVKQARAPHKAASNAAPEPAFVRTSTKTYTPPEETEDVELPSGDDGGPAGDNSLIFLLMVVLLFLVFWKTIVVPLASIAWNTSNTDITTLPWKQFLVGFAFVGVVTFISSLSSGAYKMMLLFVAALYVVYIVETQGGVVTNLANWANTPINQPGQKGKPTGGPVG